MSKKKKDVSTALTSKAPFTGSADDLAREATESIDVQRTRSKEKETYPLKLTQIQRESILEHVPLPRALRVKFEEAGEGLQTVIVTWDELVVIREALEKAADKAKAPFKGRLISLINRVRKFLEGSDARSRKLAAQEMRRLTNSGLLFQFKVTLLNISPKIWRRILVPDCTLVQFHEYLQAAFGWGNCHLHQFEIDGERFSQPNPFDREFDTYFQDDTTIRLSYLLPNPTVKARWIYEYDFGDGWRHEVLFERLCPRSDKANGPSCVAGKRACPPEDCGGPWGYRDLLAALENPRHERNKELTEWLGAFDSEEFDAKLAAARMRKLW